MSHDDLTLTRYMTLEAGAGGPLARFLLDHGTRHTPRPLPPGVPLGVPKQCFFNAGVLLHAAENMWGELRYAEGMALSALSPIGVHHGWLVDEQLNVFDPTWHAPVGREYIGVTFSRAEHMELIKQRLMTNQFYSLLDRQRDMDDWLKRQRPAG